MSRKGPAPLSIVQQAMGIRALWPVPAPKLKRGQLLWIGKLQPTPVSPVYTVRLRYDGSYPRVHVLDPKLDPGHQSRLPHVYSGNELCLYTPGEWKAIHAPCHNRDPLDRRVAPPLRALARHGRVVRWRPRLRAARPRPAGGMTTTRGPLMKLIDYFKTFLTDTVNLKPSKLEDLDERCRRSPKL